ncbi:MAG: hypothetical protein PHN42_05690 [Bacilli bacterium]|jgi:isopropylmalate/homocitrate/citramalate synthase|nr:hypothetical protein [Bacilli bacterium]
MSNQSEQITEINDSNYIVDDNKLNIIVKRIIQLENDNVKTREFNDEEIKKKIEKIIEEELKCC